MSAEPPPTPPAPPSGAPPGAPPSPPGAPPPPSGGAPPPNGNPPPPGDPGAAPAAAAPALKPQDRSATLMVPPRPTGAAEDVDRALGWLGPLGWLGALLFLPEPLLEPVLWRQFRVGARVLRGRDVPLDLDALVVPSPAGLDGAQPVPVRWGLHELTSARWMLARADKGRPPQYALRLTRGDGTVLVLVDPPKGLTRKLEKRGATTVKPFGAALVWLCTAAWWFFLGALAYRFLPWADFWAALRVLRTKL